MGNYEPSLACYVGRPLPPLPEDRAIYDSEEDLEIPSSRAPPLAITYNWEERGEDYWPRSSDSPRSSEFSKSSWEYSWSSDFGQSFKNNQKLPSWCLDVQDLLLDGYTDDREPPSGKRSPLASMRLQADFPHLVLENRKDDLEMSSTRLFSLAINPTIWDDKDDDFAPCTSDSPSSSESSKSSREHSQSPEIESSWEHNFDQQKMPSWCLDAWDVITVPGPDGLLHLGVWC